MLMGCRELKKLGEDYAIIKGDSFSAVQWGQVKLDTRGNWRIGWKKFSRF